MPNKYVLNIYPQAARDMESIFEYIAITLCNPTAAAKQVRDFEKALNIVCSQPESCALIQNEYVKDRTLRKLIVILFSIMETEKCLYHRIWVIMLILQFTLELP